jgi:hypothetical protein
MRRSIVAVVLAFCPLLSGCAHKSRENREFLLAHGFRQSAIGPHIYELQHVRLADVSRDLGFPLAALRRVDGVKVGEDVRIVEAHGLHFAVESEVVDKQRSDYKVSLNDPNAICTVRASIIPAARRPEYLKTDSSPRMRVKSVTVPEDRSKPFQITFELAAEGTTPLGLKQSQFAIAFSPLGTTPRHSPNADATFPKGTPDRIIVSPGKPITLTVSASISYWERAPSTQRRLLPAGEYILCVAVVSGKDESEGPRFDYQWVFHTWSDEYKFAIK